MKRLLPLAAVTLTTACATLPPSPAGPTASIGQIAVAGPYRVTPLRIVEDSRCPADVRCVWAGRLVIEAAVAGPGAAGLRSLELGKGEAMPTGMITLIDALPVRRSTDTPTPENYRFTFDFRP